MRSVYPLAVSVKNISITDTNSLISYKLGIDSVRLDTSTYQWWVPTRRGANFWGGSNTSAM